MSVPTACGLPGWAYAVDVCNDQALASLVTRIEKDVGEVTALINAAGIIQGAAVLKETRRHAASPTAMRR